MAVDNESLAVVECVVAPEDSDLITELLSGLEVDFACERNRETGLCTMRVYGPVGERQAVAGKIAALFADCRDLLAGPPPELRVSVVRREDWSEVWKKHFHTFKASRRLVVKPSWEEWQPTGDEIVLEIDPGMTFGTGYHGTTRACLEFIDDLAARLGPVSLLDAGCGSGILSLAATKLGYRPVHAFDHDPDAVRMTRENLARANAVSVTPVCADLAEYTPPQPCRVVVANILATVLSEHAGRILSFVDGADGGGHLILAGILTEQYESVRARFVSLGAEERVSRTIAEWTSGCFFVASQQS